MRSVLEAFSTDPALKAVTLDRSSDTISIATLGRTDYTELQNRLLGIVEKAESSATSRCSLLDGTATCLTCRRPIEPERHKTISVVRQGPSISIERVSCLTAPKLYRWSRIPWPKVAQRDIEFLPESDEIEPWQPQMIAAVLCGLFGLGGYFLHPAPLGLICYLLSYLAGSWFTSQEIWERLQKRVIDVHLLMLTVAVGSASIGAWGEGAMLLFLFSFSSALEHLALGRTQREIRSLFREAPKMATVIGPDGHEHEMAVDRLTPGLRLLVKPGGQFPVDAEIVQGQTAADESHLTGESTPVDKQVGHTVLAGSLNLWGAVTVQVLRPASESALQRIVHLIREAQKQKAPAQKFTDRFSAIYTYVVIALAGVMFFVWWLGFGQPAFIRGTTQHSAFYHTMTLLVVSSPCALVLSIPSAVLAAIAWSARRGILLRGGAAVEKLAAVHVVALDKTGTLTTGELEVARVETFPAGREAELARWAFSLERLSTHPLARAVTRYGKQQRMEPIHILNFESIAGQGLLGRNAEGQTCRLGRRDWVGADPTISAPPVEPGFCEVWIAAGTLVGRLVLRDDIRPQSRQVIQDLRAMGLRTVVLTGDRRPAAEFLKRNLDLDDVRPELKPEDKVAAIRELSALNQRVAMVGDGVNDAPSLAAAHVGVAMGARGSDAALEQADVVLMHDRLENFLAAYHLSRRARAVIRQNLAISLGTVVVLVVFAIWGTIPLTVGVVGHEGSTVIVVMNSLRLLFQGGRAS